MSNRSSTHYFHCQKLLRRYLSNKGLGQKAVVPPPLQYEIDLFQKDGKGGPDTESPRFDWLNPFSSAWNDSMVFQLANEFKEDHLGRIPHDSRWDDISYLKELIPRKLKRTRQAYKDSLPPPPESSMTHEQKQVIVQKRDSTLAKNRRRTTRREGVRLTFTQMLIIVNEGAL
jgi:hypothetical protein